jgi:hypothetical protein
MHQVTCACCIHRQGHERVVEEEGAVGVFLVGGEEELHQLAGAATDCVYS